MRRCLHKMTTTSKMCFLLLWLCCVSVGFATTVFGPPVTPRAYAPNVSVPSDGYLPAYVLIYPLGPYQDHPLMKHQPYNPPANYHRPNLNPPAQSRQNETTASESALWRFLSKLQFWKSNASNIPSTTAKPTTPLPQTTTTQTAKVPTKYNFNPYRPFGMPLPSSTPDPQRPQYTVYPNVFKNPSRPFYSQPHPDNVKYYQYAYVVPMMDPGSKYLYLTYYPSYAQTEDRPRQPQPEPEPESSTIPPISLYIPKKPMYIVPDEPFRPIQPNFRTSVLPTVSSMSTDNETVTTVSTTPVTSASTMIPTMSGNNTDTSDSDTKTTPGNGTSKRGKALRFDGDKDWFPLVPLNG